MKIWEEFKEYLLTKAVNGNLFYTNRTLPETDKEKYWYNRGLQDSLMDVKCYEAQCETIYSKKYDSLIKCLNQNYICVYYNDVTNTTHISIKKDDNIRDLLFNSTKEVEIESVDKIKNCDYGLWTAIQILESTLGKVYGYQTDDGILEHKCAINAVKNLYEQITAWNKEDEYQINTILHGLDLKREIYKKEGNKAEEERYTVQYNWLKSLKSKCKGFMESAIEHDKDEPKFKVGDFIVMDYCQGRVVELTNDAYLLDTGQGIPFSCSSTRLWNIAKDAKDGDVLAESKRDVILIFRGIGNTRWDDVIDYYCYYDYHRKEFFVQKDLEYWGNIEYNQLKPATKEQRDVLFSKMKEAGYEWDAVKKELKKIK